MPFQQTDSKQRQSSKCSRTWTRWDGTLSAARPQHTTLNSTSRLGWFLSTCSSCRQMMVFNDAPLLLLLNPNTNALTAELPIGIFETFIDVAGDVCDLIFV